LDLSGIYIGDDFGIPPSIEYLRISGGAAAAEFPFSNHLPVEFPKLRTLIFSDVPWVTNNTLLVFLVDAKAPLKVLHVDSCFRLHGAPLTHHLCEHSNKLTELNISHIIGINDSVTSRIVEDMPNLRVINLSHTDITGISIKALTDAQPSDDSPMKIERIYVKGCENVSSDAVAYGRSSGIEIII
jgi:F-box/TPR repeat protein Pof3